MAGVVGHLCTPDLERLAIVVRAFQVNAGDDDHRTPATDPVGMKGTHDQQIVVDRFLDIVPQTCFRTAP